MIVPNENLDDWLRSNAKASELKELQASPPLRASDSTLDPSGTYHCRLSYSSQTMEAQIGMLATIKEPITARAEQIRTKFQALLDKTNKENPRPQDVKALSDLLVGHKSLELWRGIASAGYLAELTVIENAAWLVHDQPFFHRYRSGL